MILIIDNYDSFTYNLVQYLGELSAEMEVYRNDKITLREIESMSPEKIVISPGPCTPKEAGVSVDLVKKFGPSTPILGVCLGHQCIGYAYGGEVIRAPELMHGKTSLIHHHGTNLYKDLPSPFEAIRYHSLIVNRENLPACFRITSETEEGIIMGIRHSEYPVEGVQFHPESILTHWGKTLLKNFLAG